MSNQEPFYLVRERMHVEVKKRNEKHGDEDVSAYDVILSAAMANAILAKLNPELRPALYTQEQAAMVEHSATPVSGQAASIDTPDFRDMVISASTELVNNYAGKHTAKLVQFIDSRPRSEDSRADALEAARIAYASEFPPNVDGEPDVGNIHANIRKLKDALATTAAPERSGQAAQPQPAIQTPGEDVCHSPVCDDRCSFPRCMGPAPAPAIQAQPLTDAAHPELTPMFLANAAMCIESPGDVQTRVKRDILKKLLRISAELQDSKKAKS